MMNPTIHLPRRRFLQGSVAAAAGVGAAWAGRASEATDAPALKLPESIRALEPITGRATPITLDERRQRLARAQELMAAHRIDAIYIDGGSTLDYFAGLNWWVSERMMGMLLPRSGAPVYITPAFERDRAQAQIRLGDDIRTWQENESPYAILADILRGSRKRGGVLGIEDKVPWFRSEGIAKAAPHVKLVAATPVTAGCRAIKSGAELALMQIASEATLSVYRAVYEALEPGMTQKDVGDWIAAAYARLGVRGFASVNVGEYTALPHGSDEPQVIREGTPVMLDDGCYVEGYMSDLTRTFTLGEASDEMKRVFDIVRRAQAAALAAARPGASMESLDAAARTLITDHGFGPGYAYFTHRLGHGIGMDMHEWYYLVEGNKRKLAPGMTFSNEPGIYIKGAFGVRLEDDMVITEDGARLLTPPSTSIEAPFA